MELNREGETLYNSERDSDSQELHSRSVTSYERMETDASMDRDTSFTKEEPDHSNSSQEKEKKIKKNEEGQEKKNMSYKLKEMKESNTRLKGQLEQVTTQLSEMKKESNRLMGQLEEVTRKMTEKEVESNRLKERLQEMTTQLTEKEKESNRLKGQLEEVTRRLIENDKESNRLKGQLEEVTRRLTEKDKESNRLKGQLEEVTRKLTEKDEESNRLKGQLEEVTRKLTEKDEESNRLKGQLEEVTRKLTEKDEESNRLKGQLEEVTRKLTEKEEESNRLKRQLEEVTTQLTEKEKESNRLMERLQEANHMNRKLKNIHFFIWLTSVLVLVPLGIGLYFDFKGHEVNHPELRLMLVGKTGAGKSASGNTILREEAFRVEASPASVTTTCKAKNKLLDGKNITIIDTPGVLDTWLISNRKANHAHDCISMFSPKPHVFLLVIRLGRFTVEENNALKWIQENFGEEALNFTLILFTGGDLLEKKPVENFISNSYELQNLVDTCKGRYHVLNNYDKSNRTQVTELLEKINVMLHLNMGYFYTKESSNFNSKEMAIRQEEELKRKTLKEEMQTEERRKINKMAMNLRDEQYEIKNLKAELEDAYQTSFWFKVSTGFITLILIIVFCKKK